MTNVLFLPFLKTTDSGAPVPILCRFAYPPGPFSFSSRPRVVLSCDTGIDRGCAGSVWTKRVLAGETGTVLCLFFMRKTRLTTLRDGLFECIRSLSASPGR